MIQTNQNPTNLGSLLDSGPWTFYQKRVVALTAAAVIFDGLDIQIVGFAIPSIAKDWALPKSLFASVLAAGLFGVALGSALGGLIGDRIGRRPALIVSVLFFAASTCGMALTNSLIPLLLLRFCAGLGIGGALPNAATLVSEYTPRSRRPFATTLAIVCIPVGGVIAGLIASFVLASHSWRLLFITSGVLPLLFGCVLLGGLPESPRFLAKDRTKRERLRKILRDMGSPAAESVDLTFPEEALLVRPKLGPLALFAAGRARDTAAIWTAFFFCLLTVYLAFNWLPSILLGCHFTLKESSEGLTLYNFGGILGALAVGWWISLKGSRLPMSLSAGLAILSAILLACLVVTNPGSHTGLLLVIGVHGLAVNAVQTTLYGLATHLYATHIRSTGVAFALAIGRIGAILSAFLGARLLSIPSTTYFLVLAATMSFVLIAILFIRNQIESVST